MINASNLLNVLRIHVQLLALIKQAVILTIHTLTVEREYAKNPKILLSRQKSVPITNHGLMGTNVETISVIKNALEMMIAHQTGLVQETFVSMKKKNAKMKKIAPKGNNVFKINALPPMVVNVTSQKIVNPGKNVGIKNV